MSFSINRQTWVGVRLTKAAEMSYTKSGKAIVKFSIAVSSSYKDQSGQWVETPHYFDCVLYGQMAERLMPHLVKGARVAIEARPAQNRWTGSDGKQHSRVEFVVEQLILMDWQKRDAADQGGYADPPVSAPVPPAAPGQRPSVGAPLPPPDPSFDYGPYDTSTGMF